MCYGQEMKTARDDQPFAADAPLSFTVKQAGATAFSRCFGKGTYDALADDRLCNELTALWECATLETLRAQVAITRYKPAAQAFLKAVCAQIGEAKTDAAAKPETGFFREYSNSSLLGYISTPPAGDAFELELEAIREARQRVEAGMLGEYFFNKALEKNYQASIAGDPVHTP